MCILLCTPVRCAVKILVCYLLFYLTVHIERRSICVYSKFRYTYILYKMLSENALREIPAPPNQPASNIAIRDHIHNSAFNEYFCVTVFST